MNNEKEDRIAFLEKTIKELLEENKTLEMKSYHLEQELNTILNNKPQTDFSTSNYDDFLNQAGELIRPTIHDIKSKFDFILYVFNQIAKERESFNHVTQQKIMLGSQSIEYIKKRLSDLSYLVGKQSKIFIELNLNNIINSISKFHVERNSRIDFNLDLSNSDTNFMGDKESIEQIIDNLLTNAEEACISSNRKGIIKLSSKVLNDQINFIICDNGVGIDERLADRIFDLNFTTKKSGFGIGLHLAKKAVLLHKGTIEMKPNKDFGLSFSIKIPKI